MYTIVSNKYGKGEYKNLYDLVKSIEMSTNVTLHERLILCNCWRPVLGLVDENGEIVAVETSHVDHLVH
jgi:hypothetical protein